MRIEGARYPRVEKPRRVAMFGEVAGTIAVARYIEAARKSGAYTQLPPGREDYPHRPIDTTQPGTQRRPLSN